MPTVLVVDDEPAIRAMIAVMLEQDGFIVVTAGDGQEAIRLSRSHQGQIDLVLSDVTMPEMDGHALAKELWAANPALPVLFMSGHCEADQEDWAQYAILQKPFSVASLLSAVRGVLSRGASTA